MKNRLVLHQNFEFRSLVILIMVTVICVFRISEIFIYDSLLFFSITTGVNTTAEQ